MKKLTAHICKHRDTYYQFRILIVFFLIILSFSIASCVNTPQQMFQGTVEQMGGKPLEAIPPDYWKDVNTISVYVVTRKKISVELVKSDIDWFSTIKKTLMVGTPAYAGGSGPTAFVIAGLLTAMQGPEREWKDPEFHREINRIVNTFNWTKEGFFVNILREQLTFATDSRATFEVVSEEAIRTGQSGEPKHTDAHLSFELHIWMMGELRSSWSEPKVKLYAVTVPTVMTDEAMHRQHNEYRSLPQPDAESQGVIKAWQEWSKLKRRKPFRGMYIGSIYIETESHNKSQWLSNKGQFLEQQLKLLLQELGIKASQSIMGIKQSVR